MLQNGRSSGRRPLWIIAGSRNDWTDVLIVVPESGGATLPIFGFREEAETFLEALVDADSVGWQARQTSPGELTSVLMGPCSDVTRVALDPLPTSDGVLLDLVSSSRNRFVEDLMGEGQGTAGEAVSA